MNLRVQLYLGKMSYLQRIPCQMEAALESPYNLIITVAGKIPDVEKTVSTDVKKHGSTLVMIGKQDLNGFGGSVYYDHLDGQ